MYTHLRSHSTYSFLRGVISPAGALDGFGTIPALLNQIDETTSHLGEKVRIAGLRQTWRSGQTTTGNKIYIMALEDLEGNLDVVIYPDIYRQSKTAVSIPGPYIVEGYVELNNENGEPVIRAVKI